MNSNLNWRRVDSSPTMLISTETPLQRGSLSLSTCHNILIEPLENATENEKRIHTLLDDLSLIKIDIQEYL